MDVVVKLFIEYIQNINGQVDYTDQYLQLNSLVKTCDLILEYGHANNNFSNIKNIICSLVMVLLLIKSAVLGLVCDGLKIVLVQRK